MYLQPLALTPHHCPCFAERMDAGLLKLTQLQQLVVVCSEGPYDEFRVPDDISRLQALTRLRLTGCTTTVPAKLSTLTSLRILCLDHNAWYSPSACEELRYVDTTMMAAAPRQQGSKSSILDTPCKLVVVIHAHPLPPANTCCSPQLSCLTNLHDLNLSWTDVGMPPDISALTALTSLSLEGVGDCLACGCV